MQITIDLLKKWSACDGGYKWFVERFPKGGDVHEVSAALFKDKKFDYDQWLTSRVFEHFVKTPNEIGQYINGSVKFALIATEGSENTSSGNYSTAASSGNGSTAASSGYYSKAASSGNCSKAASSGNGSTAASSGYYSTAASSGDYSTAASSGDYSTAASSGDYSTAASSGNYSTAASSGNYSTAASSGEKTVAMVAGIGGRAKAGVKGAFALAWFDEKSDRMKIAVGVVGLKGIKPDTFYQVIEGKLKEVENA